MKKRLGILSIIGAVAIAIFSFNPGSATANNTSNVSVVPTIVVTGSHCVSLDQAVVTGILSGFDSPVMVLANTVDHTPGFTGVIGNGAFTLTINSESDVGPFKGLTSFSIDVFDATGQIQLATAGVVVIDFTGCVPVVSTASATFKLECVAQHPLLTAQVTVTGPDPAPDQFLTLVTTSGSLDPDVQDINWVTRDYAVMQADAFGAATGASLTANLVLGTTTVSSQTFTVPDCSPEVTTTTAPTTTQPAPTTTVPAPTTTQPAPPIVSVGEPPVPPVGGLPNTGSNTGWQALGAFLLLLIGTALVMVTRRRSQLS